VITITGTTTKTTPIGVTCKNGTRTIVSTISRTTESRNATGTIATLIRTAITKADKELKISGLPSDGYVAG
jgi:hypothetical protein